MRGWKWEGGEEESEMRHERMEGMSKCLQEKLNEGVEEVKTMTRGGEAWRGGGWKKRWAGRVEGWDGGEGVRKQTGWRRRHSILAAGSWKETPRWVSIDRMVNVYKAKGEREGTTEECRWDKSIRVRGEHLDRRMRPDYIAVKENETDIRTDRQRLDENFTELHTKADFLHN